MEPSKDFNEAVCQFVDKCSQDEDHRTGVILTFGIILFFTLFFGTLITCSALEEINSGARTEAETQRLASEVSAQTIRRETQGRLLNSMVDRGISPLVARCAIIWSPPDACERLMGKLNPKSSVAIQQVDQKVAKKVDLREDLSRLVQKVKNVLILPAGESPDLENLDFKGS